MAGANNSGKSTIIHALAVWEFCTTYLEYEKKDRVLLVDGPNRDGLGINIDDFSPINIPDLSYLWTNLKSGKDESKGDVDGYTLRIGCYWDLPNKPDCYLEIGLALANDKMFIKKTKSNISIQDKIPRIAYLPPFAGILAKEGWLSKAERRRNIGRGLAGSVLRNSLIELFDEHDKLYNEKKKLIQGDSKRFPSSRWDELKNISSWDILNNVLGEIFRQNLLPEKFNPEFNIYIRIKTCKIDENGEKIPNYSPRDIMVEGSGFLQWLSVFAFALDREIDILLLDEPDAHLHCKLQNLLIENLEDIVKSQNKQVLVATHSTEIIKSLHSSKIMKIESNSARYLVEESQKIGLLEGLGAEYHPLLDKLQKTKKLFLVENGSDAKLLEIIAGRLNKSWNNDIVIWPTASGHKERQQLVRQIKDKIPQLTAISLVDRDNDNLSSTLKSLQDKNFPNDLEEKGRIILRYRKWRRRHIESYLICPQSIAAAANVTVETVSTYLSNEFSINFTSPQSDHDDKIEGLFLRDCKQVLRQIEIHKDFKVSKYDIAKNMILDEICEDMITLIDELSLL